MEDPDTNPTSGTEHWADFDIVVLHPNGKANDLGEWLQQNDVVLEQWKLIPKLSLLQPYAEITCKIKRQMKNSTATADVSDTSDKDRYWSFVCWSRIYFLLTLAQKESQKL